MNNAILHIHLDILDNPRKKLLELGIQKAYTIGRRGEYRDYFDLYTILKSKAIDLTEIIRHAKEIYTGVFDEKLFLQQLIYFGDLLNFDIIPPSATAVPQPDDIKQYFKELVGGYVRVR